MLSIPSFFIIHYSRNNNQNKFFMQNIHPSHYAKSFLKRNLVSFSFHTGIKNRNQLIKHSFSRLQSANLYLQASSGFATCLNLKTKIVFSQRVRPVIHSSTVLPCLQFFLRKQCFASKSLGKFHTLPNLIPSASHPKGKLYNAFTSEKSMLRGNRGIGEKKETKSPYGKTQQKKVSLINKTLEKKRLFLKQRRLYPSVGELCTLVVTALGPKNVGIDEFSYGYSILIPNAKLGQTVNAQIIKINLNKAKYAVAKMISIKADLPKSNSLILPNVGDILTIKLNKIAVQTDNSFIGIVNSDSKLPEKYQLIIPVNNQTKVGQELQIQITKLKLKYGFAKVFTGSLNSFYPTKHFSAKPAVFLDSKGPFSQIRRDRTFEINKQEKTNTLESPKLGKLDNKVLNSRVSVNNIVKGSKITLTLPKTAKKYAKYLVMRYHTHIFFINNLLGAQLGDKVRVKFTKVGSSFVIGQVIRISPNSSQIRFALVRKNLNEMLVNGMHYGEKVVQCQAKMRNFIWNRKNLIKSKFATSVNKPASQINLLADGQNSNGAFLKQTVLTNQKVLKLEQNLLRGLQWPPFLNEDGSVIDSALIKKNRHLINLLKTRRCLNIALRELTKYAVKGRTFLFVGTKKPAAGLIAKAALFSKTSFFVNTRWLGGMLTNWKTIIKSISKIRPILKEKQKVISNILQKRAKIQTRLIKKVLSLRKKSKILIKKGKQLIAKVKLSNQNSVNNSLSMAQLSTANDSTEQIKCEALRKELFKRGQFLLEKRQNLLNKQNKLFAKILTIKEKGFFIVNKYKTNQAKLKTTYAKLHDLKLLFLLNNSIRKVQKVARNAFLAKQSEEIMNSAATSPKVALANEKKDFEKIILSFAQLKQLTALAVPLKESFADFDPSLQKSKLSTEGTAVSKNSITGLINSKNFWLVPNPPQDILNKLLTFVTTNNSFSSISGRSTKTILKNNKTSYLFAMSPTLSEGSRPGNAFTHQKRCLLNLKRIPHLKKASRNFDQWETNSVMDGDTPFKSDKNYSIKEKNTSGNLETANSSYSSKDAGPSFGQKLVLTKLLSKFSRFLPFIKNSVNIMLLRSNNLETKITKLKSTLKALKKTLTDYLVFAQQLNSELELIKTKYLSEARSASILRKKLKRHEAEKKLLQFLPKLRYLPTPKNQISVAVQLLMKRFVDPKMKYPLDLIYDEKLRKKSKKVAAARKKKWQRLETYFGGIANMTKLKKTQISKNVAIIIGQQEEINAIRECKKMGIKMFHIVDTNCNPSLADHFIPANDDSRNSIKYLLSKIVTRIRLAQKIRNSMNLKKAN